MKFYLSQIIQLFQKIEKRQINALLLYGPDKGYIDKITKTLIQKFNLVKTCIEYPDLKTSQLEIIANTPNFFRQKQLIKIRTVGESIDKSLKLALSKELFHFLVFIADELPPSSTIRRFFETENYLASLACYHDDEQKVAKIISQRFSKAGKIIEEAAIRYLTNNLIGDHQILISETDKLIYFTNQKEQVKLEDARAVVNIDSVGSGDHLCDYFSLQNLPAFLQEFIKLKQQNVNEVLIIRALIRYYLSLHMVLSKLEEGLNMELAIKSLSPPIFYKNILNFKKALNKTSIAQCVKTLKCLQQAEIDYKLNPGGFDIYMQVYNKVSL